MLLVDIFLSVLYNLNNIYCSGKAEECYGVMELRTLQYFLAVAQEQSITRAAELLHMTQPTLSRQLKELEEELGKQLFIRGSRKVVLTEDGMKLRRRAFEITELTEKTKNEIQMPEDDIAGDVFIGGGETRIMRCVTNAIAAISQEWPRITFNLYSGNAEDIREKLDSGLLDFGVFVGPAFMQGYDYIELPGKDTWGLLMREDHPLAAKQYIVPEDITGLQLVISRQSLSSNQLNGWMRKAPVKPNVTATYNLLYNASLMVESGVHCAVCLDGIVSTASGTGLVFRPFMPLLTVSSKLVWKKYQLFSRASEKFVEQLLRDLSDEGE